ncbi:MAG TPA: HAD-IA family hydrolase [Acetobacteraceae bacterium]|nr:HAD-IA family hydrolase [Acetobacteraceae bacterium]
MPADTTPFRSLAAVIFDVDGVLVASPHERAWREALQGIADPARFTTAVYQAHVAGKPRADGALAALEALGVADAAARVAGYAETKQRILEDLIASGDFTVFPDALRLAQALTASGIPIAVASSSKNANQMMRLIDVGPTRTLLDLFTANVCGRDFSRGKPDPEIFLTAAAELTAAPAHCLVVEDAPAGIKAARAGGMMSLGIARLGDEALLQAAAADLVVTSLDQVDARRLSRSAAGGETDMQDALRHTTDAGWLLAEQGYDPTRESSIESRFTVSNGFLGVRGSRAINRGPTWVSWLHTLRWASWPRTYVAGLFDTPNTEPPVPALVPAPDWLRMRVMLDGKTILQRAGQTQGHRRILDMRRGLMLTEWHQSDAAGAAVAATTLRLVSLADRAVGLQLVRLEVESGTPEVTIDARFDELSGALDQVRCDDDLAVWRTEESGKGLAMASSVALQVDETQLTPRDLGLFRSIWSWRAMPGQSARFHRLVSVSRGDDADADPGPAAAAALARAKRIGWRGVLAEHEAAWAERWRLSGVGIGGDGASAQALRFAIYHLNGAANPADERVSIGARALTGDAYLGHVFWDTEIYVLPFYIATWPEAARALLMYRYHTLPGARAKASRAGWRGAMYAWESTDTGEETTPEELVGPRGETIKVLCGTQEQHITADVAYAIWQYWQATGDDGFMLEAGAEIMLETARFWASRAQREADGLCHIRGVIGPDEYHEHIDDSAYTNVMARWNIRRGIELAACLRDRWPERWTALATGLNLEEPELRQWQDVADRLYVGFSPETGLFEQFTGYFGLDDIDMARYADRTMPLDVILGRERTQQTQVVKQADVVAILALLPEECDANARLANFRYYEPRCGHGSSLSRGMHAVVAAHLGQIELATRYFQETAATDLADSGDNSAGGVHIAALGGLWQAAVCGFGGLSLGADGLGLDPHLPAGWRNMTFHAQWRGRLVKIAIDQDADCIEATLVSGEAMPLLVRRRRHELRPAGTLRLQYGSPGR